MKKFDFQQLLQASGWSTTLLQLSLPFDIYLGIESGAGWVWWTVCAFFYIIVYSLVGNNIGLHRYFTHRHFEVAKPVEWLFAWTGSMSGLGEPMSYAMSHIVHHDPRYTDTALDPHGPGRGLKSILTIFYRRVDIRETPIHVRRIVELSKSYGWLHKYYLPFVLINAVILYLISYKLFLFCWLIPASMCATGVAAAVLTQHWHGEPNNGWHHKWFLYYEALHKNHHDYPRAPNTAINPGELDYTFQASKLFRPRYYWEGQPGHDA
jgi:stearoyl-CoA desaturase (delta-9 desaturase)